MQQCESDIYEEINELVPQKPYRSKAPPVVYLAYFPRIPISVSAAEVYIRCALFGVGMVGNWLSANHTREYEMIPRA